MGLLDKINLLHVFMFILFVIGLLLIITTFSAYSKLGSDCTSPGLRTKLRWAIGIGTVFFTLSIGYSVCVTRKGCKCDFGERATWKIYAMLIALMGMGGGLLALSTGIKSDLKKCNVNLGSIPDIITGLAVVQIVLPALYIAWIVYSGRPLGSKKVTEEVEEESDESLALKAQSERSAINTRRLQRYNKTIQQKSAQLDAVRDRIEIAREKKKNPSIKDLQEQDRLVLEIAEAQKGKKSVGTTSSAGSIGSMSASSSGSSSSSGLGGFGGFGGGFTFPDMGSSYEDDES